MTSQDFANQNNFNQVYDSSYLRDYLYKDYIQAGTGTSIDNSVVRWDGTDATTIQGTSVLLDDSNVFTIPTGDNLVFSGSGCITFTDTSGNTISIQGASGSIDFTQRLRLPATMGATGSVLAIENITGINYDLSWEADVLLISDGNTVDNSVVRWDGTSGSNVQDSNLIIDDSNNLIIPSGVNSNITFSGSGGVIFTEDGGANTYTIRGPSTLASDITLTLPNSIGTSGQLLQTDGSGNMSWATVSSAQPTPVVPDWDFSNYSQAGLTEYLRMRSGFSEIATGSPYTSILATDSNPYVGGVYDPCLNRIYLVPYGEGTQGAGTNSEWLYINCATGTNAYVEQYDTGINKSNFQAGEAYAGGAYSPTENRIYFAPDAQSNQTDWHYIDCGDGSVVQYAHGLGADTPPQYAYWGAVYAPTLNRIYFIPHGPSMTKWVYIQCDGSSPPNAVAYTHGSTSGTYGYAGGAYSPSQNRIYFSPWGAADESKWTYIDCSDGSVVDYTHGVSAVNIAYQGAVYSPTEDRIYFVPFNQVTQSTWHYVDCSDGTIGQYSRPADFIAYSNQGFSGGAYFPGQNRIYYAPNKQSSIYHKWIYIDCSNGTAVTYDSGATGSNVFAGEAFYGAVYAPTQNRIYFTPYQQAYSKNYWYYIEDADSVTMPRPADILMAGGLFNYDP